jgi:hypothetical protein
MDDTRVKKRLIKDKKPSILVTWTSDVIKVRNDSAEKACILCEQGATSKI